MHKKNKIDLTPTQQIVINVIANSSLRDKVYWTGGTALSYFYLHHRLSYDLDFFSDKKIDYDEILKVIKLIAEQTKLKKITEEKIFDRREFILHNNEKILIEFAVYEYKNLKSRKKWQGIFVDSLEDIAANKTLALIERHEPKDVVDIYFLLTKRNFTPSKLLDLVQKKFGIKFSIQTFWSQCLLAIKTLKSIKPLLIGTEEKKKKIIENIIKYIENESAKAVRKLLK